MRLTGQVEYFNAATGRGSIRRDDDDLAPSVFLHIRQARGFVPQVGQHVEFELLQDKGRCFSRNVDLLEFSPAGTG